MSAQFNAGSEQSGLSRHHEQPFLDCIVPRGSLTSRTILTPNLRSNDQLIRVATISLCSILTFHRQAALEQYLIASSQSSWFGTGRAYTSRSYICARNTCFHGRHMIPTHTWFYYETTDALVYVLCIYLKNV